MAFLIDTDSVLFQTGTKMYTYFIFHYLNVSTHEEGPPTGQLEQRCQKVVTVKYW
jgi:3-methyladenine DNA glycosylase Mpg